MADYRQEVELPGFRNLVLNPGGESTSLGSSFVASNGSITTGLTVEQGGPTPVSGSSVLAYQVLDNTSLSYFFAPLGPTEPVHRSGFRIPLARTVSAKVRVRSSAPCWVQFQASWMTEHWEGGTENGLSAPFQIDSVGSPLAVTNSGWSELVVQVPEATIPAGASHWRPLVAVYSSNPATAPSAPPIGLQIFVDNFFVSDSGASLASAPYGDGNLPGWEWEGEPNFSSSRTIPDELSSSLNFVYDPSTADGSLAPWAVYNSGVSTATSVVEDGKRAIKVERVTANSGTAGGVYTGSLGVQKRSGGIEISFSAEIKVPAGGSSLPIQLILRDSTANDSLVLDDITSGELITTVPATGSWTRVFVTGTIKGDRVLDTVYVIRGGMPLAPAGEVFFVRNIMLSDGELEEFFDGDTPDTVEFSYGWTGTPYASASAKYPLFDVDPSEDVEPTGDDPMNDPAPLEGYAGIDTALETIEPDSQVAAPVVPDVSVDDFGPTVTSLVLKDGAARAEDVIGWKNANRHLCLSKDVEIEGLVMNTIDSYGVVWLVSDLEGWWTTPEPEVPDVPRAWFDGSYETRGRYGARTFNLVGSFIPHSPRDVSAARDRLIRAVNLCHAGGWFMTHETLGGERLTKGAKVWLAGQPLITTTGLNGKTDFSIALRAPDSLKHSIKDAVPPGYNSLSLLTTSSQYPERGFPKTYPWKYPEAVFGSTSAIAVNDGNAVTWPILRLAGPTNGAIRIFNSDTQQEFRIKRKLYAGEVLEIDCFTRQVTLNGEGNFRFYLDVDVDWLMLQPGSNKIWFSEEVIGKIRTELEILWRSSWIG